VGKRNIPYIYAGMLSRSQNAAANLGVAYRERGAGEIWENQERAIAAFANALSVWSRESHPEQWAAARMNLGIAYRECAADEGSDSRDRAIEAFEEALSVWTRDSKPMAWAAARMQPGGAYLENSAGDRKGNLERAIAALEDALSVLTREAIPQEWAAAQMKLGMAGVRVRERLKALTARSILLPITRTAGQPQIRDVRDLGRTP
jgi:tetratricopeptide (TPR) repeat protein